MLDRLEMAHPYSCDLVSITYDGLLLKVHDIPAFNFILISVTRNQLQTEDPQDQSGPGQAVPESGHGPLSHHQLQGGPQVQY